jgi:FHA domain
MADPRLNSVHLEAPRRQEYRRARDVLLHARGSHTIYADRADQSELSGHTIIQKGDGVAAGELVCWLLDGEFIYPLKVGLNTLGRSNDNDVVVEDAYVSRRHCAVLVHSNQTCELHDTASKNGTYLNGTRLAGPAILKPGDEIRVSNQQLIFQTRSGEGDAAFPYPTLQG